MSFLKAGFLSSVCWSVESTGNGHNHCSVNLSQENVIMIVAGLFLRVHVCILMHMNGYKEGFFY